MRLMDHNYFDIVSMAILTFQYTVLVVDELIINWNKDSCFRTD